VRDYDWPVHKEENRNGQQCADEYGHSGKEPDLLLMRRQHWFSSMRVAVSHNFKYVGPCRFCHQVFTP
jgi:hypothetical protein